MTLEHDIQDGILRGLGVKTVMGGGSCYVTVGSVFWRTNSGVRGRLRCNVPGCPDILGCVHGRMVGIEVKKPGGKQSEAQVRFQRVLEAAGGVYILTDTVAGGVAPVVEMMRRAA